MIFLPHKIYSFPEFRNTGIPECLLYKYSAMNLLYLHPTLLSKVFAPILTYLNVTTYMVPLAPLA